MADIERTDKEIEALIEKCQKFIDRGSSRYPGMMYEQGIRDAIDWLTDEDQETPMED